eukprot:349040_1
MSSLNYKCMAIRKQCLILSILLVIAYKFITIDISILCNTFTTSSTDLILNSIKWIDSYSFDNGFKHNFPPFLISFPCSGNTFTRLLLEHTTLYWTGSVFPLCDDEKKNYSKIPLKFQNCADKSVLVIKMHPLYWENDHLDNIMNMNFTSTYQVNKTNEMMKKKELMWHSIVNKYNTAEISAIFLLRDMFKSCWSYFQFLHASKYDTQIWTKYANNLHMGVQNHISSFIMSKHRFESELLLKWTVFSLQCSQNWLNEFKWIDKFEKNNKTILIVEFEKLLNNKYRETEMSKILQFLFTKRYLKKYKQEMLIRMEYNMKNISNMERAEYIYRNKTRLNRIDAKHAYSLLSDQHICKMLKNARNQSMLIINSPREVHCMFI